MSPKTDLIGVEATLLTPLYYHGVYVPDGSATDSRVLTDTAMMFAIATILGCSPTRYTRATPDYRADLRQIPWRSTLFCATNDTHLLPPVRHTIDVEREGGYSESLRKQMESGNFKKTFYVNEIAVGARYTGALYGPDPFALADSDELVVRMGVARTGMVELRRTTTPDTVILNTATTALFGITIPETYRILDTIRVSSPIPRVQAQETFELMYS